MLEIKQSSRNFLLLPSPLFCPIGENWESLLSVYLFEPHLFYPASPLASLLPWIKNSICVIFRNSFLAYTFLSLWSQLSRHATSFLGETQRPDQSVPSRGRVQVGDTAASPDIIFNNTIFGLKSNCCWTKTKDILYIKLWCLTGIKWHDLFAQSNSTHVQMSISKNWQTISNLESKYKSQRFLIKTNLLLLKNI